MADNGVEDPEGGQGGGVKDDVEVHGNITLLPMLPATEDHPLWGNIAVGLAHDDFTPFKQYGGRGGYQWSPGGEPGFLQKLHKLALAYRDARHDLPSGAPLEDFRVPGAPAGVQPVEVWRRKIGCKKGGAAPDLGQAVRVHGAARSEPDKALPLMILDFGDDKTGGRDPAAAAAASPGHDRTSFSGLQETCGKDIEGVRVSWCGASMTANSCKQWRIDFNRTRESEGKWGFSFVWLADFVKEDEEKTKRKKMSKKESLAKKAKTAANGEAGAADSESSELAAGGSGGEGDMPTTSAGFLGINSGDAGARMEESGASFSSPALSGASGFEAAGAPGREVSEQDRLRLELEALIARTSEALTAYLGSKGVSEDEKEEIKRSTAQKLEAVCEDTMRQHHKGWPDFVFTDIKYEIMVLDDVSAFVEQYGRLPWNRAARVIDNGGFDVRQEVTNLAETVENFFIHFCDHVQTYRRDCQLRQAGSQDNHAGAAGRAAPPPPPHLLEAEERAPLSEAEATGCSVPAWGGGRGRGDGMGREAPDAVFDILEEVGESVPLLGDFESSSHNLRPPPSPVSGASAAFWRGRCLLSPCMAQALGCAALVGLLLCAALAFWLAPRITVPLVHSMGFGIGGIVHGSFAAWWEARYKGDIPKGGLFTELASLGARGKLTLNESLEASSLLTALLAVLAAALAVCVRCASCRRRAGLGEPRSTDGIAGLSSAEL